ncbi:hypothetical protein GCM10011357_18750 [Lacimicrobium alkaliphilum]|uniref:Uncharacterized protein n=2 Tax=Lacimicrobium alkaliphilum TaxID=1526571 RepID=A0ABQ1RCA1_9ALTE|nr:hypothetical protein GCM10011357_18750 [Lacimicrobium alkaliphilum]
MLCSSTSLADGLTDLQQALESLKGTTPISATLTNTFTEKRGEGKDLKEQQGSADILLNDNGQGLQITYSKAILDAMDEEARQKLEDEDVPTPTQDAVNNLEASELKTTLSAAGNLQRFIQKATFQGEKEQQCENGQIRELNFDLPLEAVISNKKVRGYVNDFDGQYQIWIDKKGFPLKSRLSFSGSGRAFIFFSMQAQTHATTYYQVAGNRLVILDREYHRAYDSSWDTSETQGRESLVLHQPQISTDSTLVAQCNVTDQQRSQG